MPDFDRAPEEGLTWYDEKPRSIESPMLIGQYRTVA